MPDTTLSDLAHATMSALISESLVRPSIIAHHQEVTPELLNVLKGEASGWTETNDGFDFWGTDGGSPWRVQLHA